jgi:hypothetical protein
MKPYLKWQGTFYQPLIFIIQSKSQKYQFLIGLSKQRVDTIRGLVIFANKLPRETHAIEFVFVLDVLSNEFERVHRPLHRRVQLPDIVHL